MWQLKANRGAKCADALECIVPGPQPRGHGASHSANTGTRVRGTILNFASNCPSSLAENRKLKSNSTSFYSTRTSPNIICSVRDSCNEKTLPHACASIIIFIIMYYLCVHYNHCIFITIIIFCCAD